MAGYKKKSTRASAHNLVGRSFGRSVVRSFGRRFGICSLNVNRITFKREGGKMIGERRKKPSNIKRGIFINTNRSTHYFSRLGYAKK